jgi:hypothetical protein
MSNTVYNLDEMLGKFKAGLNAQSNINIHSPFKPGNEVTGVYTRDATQRTAYGPQKIIVITQVDNQEIGILRTPYINTMIELYQACPGDLVSITCTGTEISRSGNEYAKLDIVFADPATLAD